jgi:ATP adenylyltransferase
VTERLWAPWRLEYVAGAGEAGGCIFCDKPALSDDDALILHRGRHAFAVLNLYPYANGHLMVAPYRHLPMPGDLNAEAGPSSGSWPTTDHRADAAMAPHGFNCGMNLGRAAGAGVEGHLHMHVVPRWNGDTTSCRCWRHACDARAPLAHAGEAARRVAGLSYASSCFVIVTAISAQPSEL